MQNPVSYYLNPTPDQWYDYYNGFTFKESLADMTRDWDFVFLVLYGLQSQQASRLRAARIQFAAFEILLGLSALGMGAIVGWRLYDTNLMWLGASATAAGGFIFLNLFFVGTPLLVIKLRKTGLIQKDGRYEMFRQEEIREKMQAASSDTPAIKGILPEQSAEDTAAIKSILSEQSAD